MSSSLLVTCEHVPQGRPSGNGVVERENGAPGHAEAELDSVVLKPAQDNVRTVLGGIGRGRGWVADGDSM
jgi:hypothetical protein